MGHNLNGCAVLNNISFLKKPHNINWKFFLDKARWQQNKTSHENKINQQELEYLEVKEEQDMPQEANIGFDSNDHEYVQYNQDFW